MSKFGLFSDDYLFKFIVVEDWVWEKCFGVNHTVPMRVLMHKIDVSLVIDLVALYMNS